MKAPEYAPNICNLFITIISTGDGVLLSSCHCCVILGDSSIGSWRKSRLIWGGLDLLLRNSFGG